MIQASNDGGQFMAGKSIKDKNTCVAGSIALALHARVMPPYYGIPVIMHSDHCAKKLLPWFDGMLEADEAYFAQYGVPLFSSHMLDLSKEPDEENIAICIQYMKKMGEYLFPKVTSADAISQLALLTPTSFSSHEDLVGDGNWHYWRRGGRCQ